MKKPIAVVSASVVAIAIGGGAATMVSAQSPYDPYNPGPTTTGPTTTGPTTTQPPVTVPPTTTTTPTPPVPPRTVRSVRAEVTTALRKVTRLASRTSVTLRIAKATPGRYTVTIKRGSRTLFTGTKLLRGTTAKTLNVRVKSTASSRRYLRSLKRRNRTVTVKQTTSYRPTGGKTSRSTQSYRAKL